MGVAFPLFRTVKGTPRDAKLDVVVLESDERNSRLPVFTKGESKRVKPAVPSLGETRLGLGEVLCKKRGSNVLGKGGRLIINHLTTDEKLHLLNPRFPLIGGENNRVISIIGSKVHIAEEVTLALEANRGHATRGGVALDHLTLDGLGKVRVTLVVGTEKGNLGLPDDVCILGTNGNELGDSTRHFIL